MQLNILIEKKNLRFQKGKLVELWINLNYFVVLEYKKVKELKNTKVDINNLVLRHYDNKNHEH